MSLTGGWVGLAGNIPDNLIGHFLMDGAEKSIRLKRGCAGLLLQHVAVTMKKLRGILAEPQH